MPLENVHTPDNEKGKVESKENQNEKIQSDKKNYEKVFNEEQEKEEIKEKEEAVNILPESMIAQRVTMNEKINQMEDGETKKKLTTMARITGQELKNEHRDTAKGGLDTIKEILDSLNSVPVSEKETSPVNDKTTEETKEGLSNQKIEGEETIEENNDITKDMQKLGKIEKIDENNYIVTLDIPRTNLSDIQEGNIKEIKNKGFTVKYIGDDSGKITQLKIIGQNS